MKLFEEAGQRQCFKTWVLHDMKVTDEMVRTFRRSPPTRDNNIKSILVAVVSGVESNQEIIILISCQGCCCPSGNTE